MPSEANGHDNESMVYSSSMIDIKNKNRLSSSNKGQLPAIAANNAVYGDLLSNEPEPKTHVYSPVGNAPRSFHSAMSVEPTESGGEEETDELHDNDASNKNNGYSNGKAMSTFTSNGPSSRQGDDNN